MSAVLNPTRRSFLHCSLATGGGLLAAFHLPARGAQPAAGQALQPNAFVRLAPDGRITVIIGHTEMGQGVSTAIPMLVAEELDADWAQVAWEQAPTAPAYGHPVFHTQLTGGSMTTPSQYLPQRRAGATVRAMLVSAAAKRWGVDAASLTTERSRVLHAASGRSLGYGELAAEAALLPVPQQVALKSPAQFRLIGQPLRRLDAGIKVDGRAVFGIDFDAPGLLTALVAHPPRFGARAVRVDSAAAKRVPGVVAVYPLASGVAVVAKGFWPAFKARRALKIDWEGGERLSSPAQRAVFTRLLGEPGTPATPLQPPVSGARELQADYHVPYLAHAPMEPLGAVVQVGPKGADIWVSTQWPGGDQQVAAALLGLKPEQVRVHSMLAGGGFGRRSYPGHDFVREAVLIAQAGRALQAPIKLIWTRDDDIHGGAYRPAAAVRLRAVLDERGQALALHSRIVAQSIGITTPFAGMIVKDGVDHLSVEGSAAELAYSLPRVQAELHTVDNGVPVTWMRGVGHSFNAYAVESFMDELAAAAGDDPYRFRRRLLAEKPRLLAVLDAVARHVDWARAAPAGVGRGIAVHASYGALVATIIEVSAVPALKVQRVVVAIDCGTVINPDLVRAQMESSVVFALSSALHGEITLKGGEVEQHNFNDYPLLRMHEMPRIEVLLMPSSEPPSGAGEPGVACVAPALVNAIHAATGQRVRTLPVKHSLPIA